MIPPTVFHITHWKAGSQWVAEILKYSAPDRFVRDREIAKAGLVESTAIVPGKVYGSVYLSQNRFSSSIQNRFIPVLSRTTVSQPHQLKNWLNFGVLKKRCLPFVVVRDLRDTLISLYFSVKHSHAMPTAHQREVREALAAQELEAGLLEIVANPGTGTGVTLALCARIQESWLGVPDALYLRYEDIIGREREFFERLIDHCEISIGREPLRHIIDNNLFERVTGRQRGQEDVHAHLRRGIAGDWKNYFTEPVKSEFKKRFGSLLIKTGYEKDSDW